MKARAFDYVRPRTCEEAVAAFARCAGEARYLAGGQSLIPALNLRLQAPDLLIDISRIESLHGVERRGDRLRIGAATRHAEIGASALVREAVPLLAEAVPYVAHPAIRNKGTIGGSLALADPASEFPAVALALGAEIEILGSGGTRMVAADEFFTGLYETALQPGEILSAIWFPVADEHHCHAFGELARRRGDYALVGLAAQGRCAAGAIASIRLVFFSVESKPMRATTAEGALTGAVLSEDRVRAAQGAVAADLDPPDEPQVPAAMRLHLARVLLGRVLGRLGASCHTGSEGQP